MKEGIIVIIILVGQYVFAPGTAVRVRAYQVLAPIAVRAYPHPKTYDYLMGPKRNRLAFETQEKLLFFKSNYKVCNKRV